MKNVMVILVLIVFCRTLNAQTFTIGYNASGEMVKQVRSATVVPKPTLVASATTVKPTTSVTLTASGCQGNVLWSTGQKNTSSITVAPSVTTTYNAVCLWTGGCSSEAVAVKVTVSNTAGREGALESDQAPTLLGYPNPINDDVFEIDASINEVKHMQIFTEGGVEVLFKTEESVGKRLKIKLPPQLTNGILLLKVFYHSGRVESVKLNVLK